MSEMIDRVARAIAIFELGGDEVAADSPALRWDLTLEKNVKQDFPNWHDYRRSARAAIEAMREPTDAMCVAAEDEVGERDIFRAMIDEALRDG